MYHLLDAKHNGRTYFRFSINNNFIIKFIDPGKSRLNERVEAGVKVAEQEDIKDTIGGYIHHYFLESRIEYFT
ncbi:hypothetical protein J18TS1_24750 [Oceanobacillus oncorhynchi subsp. incaldanensis]|nr:hypothetical protein J18TS1_24750 [Oceanobacillus oncorhynchi subsp. incaldanensis]